MFAEELIFELYKDKVIKNRKSFIKEMQSKFRDVNVSELYVRIVNYQINSYGEMLKNYVEWINKEELRRISLDASNRKRKKLG